MDTFELFNNGKLVLPEKEAGFAEIEWSKHPTFEGVELSMRVQRGYICLQSLCLHYVELNKRIISKTAALWTSSAICGGLLFFQAGRAA